ncbi:MAG: alcohol dehydrogenase [Chloroflexi bacterium]|nr:MAG: alcohol dehydrogenase [Chloroflexota bacterium]
MIASQTMTAAVLHEHGERDVIKLEQIPVPVPGRGEVRIAVKASALNWLDVGVRRGPKFGAIDLPLIGGSDIAGVIESVGDEVHDWHVGDEVIVYPLITCGVCEFCRRGEPTTCPEHRIIGEHIDGGMAEYVVVPADNLIKKPGALSFVEAASLPVVAMTAWHMLIAVGQLRPGEIVLIPGAGGGVASIGIQIARHGGARVFATTSTPEKITKARELGASEVFNYRDADWVMQVLDATDGRGVDMVQDNVGAATWPLDLRVLARNGRLVACGSHSGTHFELDIAQIYHRQLRILGSNGGTYQDLVNAIQLAADGHIAPVIDTVLPLESIHDGHAILEDGTHFGKVVIEM